MFNFLVTAQEGAWSKGYYEFPRGRFLEFTDDDVADRFQELRKSQIGALTKWPCLFAYEGKNQPMFLGMLTSLEPTATVLKIRFEIRNPNHPLDPTIVARRFSDLDIRTWELTRTHWAIKEADLAEILTREVNLLPYSNSEHSAKELLAGVSPESYVSSVSEFVSEVIDQELDGRTAFYRGHSNRERYRLEPSLFRKDAKGNFKYRDSEDKLFRELLVSNSADFREDVHTLDRLARMQHFALPTRLLDITSNPLIALYFACRGSDNSDAEVITLFIESGRIKYFDSDTAACIANLARLPIEDKEAINYAVGSVATFNKQRPIDKLLQLIRDEKPYFRPSIEPSDLQSILCVKGKRSNDRIAFQSGAFLVFGHDAVLAESGSPQLSVRRIGIRAGDKPEILSQLDRLNINESTVFPNIEKSATYLADKLQSKR